MPDQDNAVRAAACNHFRLKTLDDYEEALSDLEHYLVKPPAQGTTASIIFYALLKQIVDYEAKHFPPEDDRGTQGVH